MGWIARYAAVTVFALALAPAAACMCTQELRWSVVVHLTDDRDVAVADATVTFESDDVLEPCMSLSAGSYGCGGEVEGTLVIHVEREGFESQERTVDVGSDHCHVDTEEVEISLMPG